MPAMDLFETYRWLLALVCTIYATVVILRSWWGWWEYFMGSRQTAVLGKYVLVLLLRTKFYRFAWELLQIAALTSLLLFLLYWHTGGVR